MLYSTDRTIGYVSRSVPQEPAITTQNSVVVIHPACKKWFAQPAAVPSVKQVSEGMWRDARKRHCDSRQHLRELLNKYVQPHAVV